MGTLGKGDKRGWIRLGENGVEEGSEKKTGKRKKETFLFLIYSYGPYIHSSDLQLPGKQSITVVFFTLES